ncbi:TonB-dependent siderophore receptor [Gemmobacter serpentinus]|uniref:TonB-dependent siderophore receptor n=1 Tax=Gemmobacter serpentinus TaxID=2652247 RepID=UPI00124C39AA|nr:TonB-dependent siderophore receptor [Gemmobacter serpentinus]
MTNTSSMTRRLLGQTAIVALLAPIAGFAQTAPVTTLEEVVLEGQITDTGTGPVGGQADPTTTTGAKTATKLSEIPQSVSVIGAEAIAAGNISKVDAALAYSAGVQAQPYGYDSDTNWFFVRGFSGTSTGAFVDGLPSYSYGFGGFYIDPAGLERIEVLRGPSSALYGASNPGGIVNMVSKRPTDTPGGTDTLGVDSSGRVWLETDRQGVTASDLSWRFIGKVERTDDMGVFDPGARVYLAPSIAFSLDGGTQVNLSATYTKIDEDHVGGGWLPYIGTVVDAPYGKIDRDFNSGVPAYDWYKRDQFTLSSEISHNFDGGWRLVNNTRFGWSDVDESTVYSYGYNTAPWGFSPTPNNPATLSRIFFQHQSETRTLLNDLRLENTFQTGGVEHRLMFGLDAKWFELDQVQGSGSVTALSIANPDYAANTVLSPTTPYADNVVNQTQFGIYAQDQLRWGDGWIATLNLRHDIARTRVSDDRTLGTPGSRRKDGETTGRIGLAKEFNNGLTVYASGSTYFNPQVVTNTAGNSTPPETGHQAEVGVKWAPSESTMITLSAFNMTRENISQSQWNGAGYDYFQIGRVASKGVELEAQHDFGNGLKVSASATTMDIRIKDDINAAIIGNTPYIAIEDMATLKVDFSPETVQGLTLSGGLRYLGSSWADNANTLRVPSALLLDAGVSYEFTDSWKANFAVTNLTDKVYVSSCQDATGCYYGEERRASLSLSHKF